MTDSRRVNSRISGFHRHNVDDRLSTLFESTDLSDEARGHLTSGGGVPVADVDRMSENVVAQAALPLSVALNFRINQRDVLVPMAVEEPSIVAAASNAARLVRISGGFHGDADPPVMTAQVQLDGVDDLEAARQRVEAERDRIIAAANEAIPRMVARGGGCRDLEARAVDPESGLFVVHLFVDVLDAMGANLVDSVAEATAPVIHELVGGRVGLRILSNLPLRRMVWVEARVSAEALGGAELSDGVARASRFAERDVFRAVTHNKGIMNAVDAVAVAMGQDWRSIEAGAHAYAALSGTYRPLATWQAEDGGLCGRLRMPLAVATVGGSTRAHGGIRAAFEIMKPRDARDLAVVTAAAGLACNLAALRALAGEGIQHGHMRLHARKDPEAPARSAKERS